MARSDAAVGCVSTAQAATIKRDSASGQTMGWDHPQPFTMSVAPKSDDIDGLNHTNNAVYVHWCGRIGWAHAEALGIHLADYQRIDRGMAIRRADYHYLLPTTVGDELTLGTWLHGGDGKLTIERRFQLIRNRDHATVLRGSWKLVCIELSSGRPRRMPPEFCSTFREAIESHGTAK